MWPTGSSLSLGSTVLTAFDQLRDNHRHPAADDTPVLPRRYPVSYRRAASQPCSSDDGQSQMMLSTSQPTPPSFSDDCPRYVISGPPSPVSSSSSSSSQFQYHLDMLQSPSATSTTVVGSDSGTAPTVDEDCSLRPDSSDDCRSATPSPPLSFCAVGSSGVGGGRCVVQAAVTGSSSYKSRVVAEIVESERKYVRDLRQIVDVS